MHILCCMKKISLKADKKTPNRNRKFTGQVLIFTKKFCKYRYLGLIEPAVCGTLRWSSSLYHSWSAATQAVESPGMWIYSPGGSEQYDVVWPEGVHGEFVGLEESWGKVDFPVYTLESQDITFEFVPGGDRQPGQWCWTLKNVLFTCPRQHDLDVLVLLETSAIFMPEGDKRPRLQLWNALQMVGRGFTELYYVAIKSQVTVKSDN